VETSDGAEQGSVIFLGVQAPGRDDDRDVVFKPIVRYRLRARLHSVDVDRVIDDLNPFSISPYVRGKAPSQASGNGDDGFNAAEDHVGGMRLQASAHPLLSSPWERSVDRGT
jgi:hypothetical protein